MRSALLVVLVAGLATEAGAAIIETARYDLIFSRSAAELSLLPDPFYGSSPPFFVVQDDSPGHHELLTLSFHHPGSPMDLSGTTVPFSALPNLTISSLDPWPHPTGTLTFGANNEVTAWDFSDSGIAGHTFSWHHSSEPISFDVTLFDLLNPEDATATEHYGLQFTEPLFYNFNLGRGLWTSESRKECTDGGAVVACPEVVAHAPIPASVFLLLAGLGGFAWLRAPSLRLSLLRRYSR